MSWSRRNVLQRTTSALDGRLFRPDGVRGLQRTAFVTKTRPRRRPAASRNAWKRLPATSDVMGTPVRAAPSRPGASRDEEHVRIEGAVGVAEDVHVVHGRAGAAAADAAAEAGEVLGGHGQMIASSGPDSGVVQCQPIPMSARLLPEYDETRWVLKALRETAHELESQLHGLREQDLRWRPSDDDWSLKEIAAHLRDCEEHFLECLELIVARARAIPCFDADALVVRARLPCHQRLRGVRTI